MPTIFTHYSLLEANSHLPYPEDGTAAQMMRNRSGDEVTVDPLSIDPADLTALAIFEDGYEVIVFTEELWTDDAELEKKISDAVTAFEKEPEE